MTKLMDHALDLLSDEQKQNIRHAALDVWDSIGWDCLQCLADERESRIESVTMSRDDVLGLILDANRLDAELKDKDQWAAIMEGLSYDEWQRVLAPAFIYDRYGI